MANDNPGYISKLHTTPDARLVDGTDNIHSGIINALNEATAGNRAVSGFNITQSNQDVDYTKYVLVAGKILRDGLLVDISGATLTTSVGPRGGNDWYALIVVNSSNALAIRVDAQTKSTASVSTLTAGDIPVAIVKYLAGSANDIITRKVQFLGHSQTTQGLSLINSGAETVRLNAAGTITKGGATLTLPSSTGTVALTSDIHYTSAIPNATSSQTGLATSTQITKLDGIEAGAKGDQTKAEIKTLFSWSTSPEDGATADQTDTQIETAYNNRVAQVSSAERTAGNSTAIKRFTPADIKSMIDTHQTDANTDTDVTLANLKTRLASNMGDNFQIGSNSAHTATFAGGLVIGGNLTVNGTTTTISSNTLAVGDNIIVLNNDVTGTPSQNAGMEIERGSATNVGVRWNESSDRWEFTNDGTTYYNLPTTAELANPYTHPLYGTTDIDTSGAEIVDAIATNDTGHITAMSKRTLTLADLGYTGATDANKYVHPNHSGDVTSSADGATTIANNAVTSAKIADNAITSAKINNGSINNDKISTSAAIAQSKISGLTGALSGKEPSLTIGDGLDRTSATLKVDIDGLTIENGMDRSADYIMYDDATNGLRRINPVNLFSKLIAGDIPDLSATYRATGTAITDSDISTGADDKINSDKLKDGSTNKVFTSTLKTKLDGIAASATVGADWSSNVSNISVTNAQLAGSIANSKLINSGVTLNGNTLNLGGSLTLDTDDFAEGSNKYYTDERVDDRVNALITDGEGITTTYDDSAGTLTVDAEIATTSNLGVASFNSNRFTVTSGAVDVKNSSIQDSHLSGSIAQNKITNLVSDLATKAPIANPTFTGSITIGSASLTEAELELIDGVVGTLTTTELGYLDGVTSSIQTQLNAKIESVAVSDLTDNISISNSISNASTNSQIPTARAVKNYIFSQEIKSYDLVLAENGDNAKIRLEDNLGDLTNFIDINAGTDISLDVDPTQRDIRISNTGKGHVASASYNQGTLTLTHRDGTTTTATIPDSTTDAHGLMTDDQFDKLAAIEALADVTDKANVVASLGLLDESDTLYLGDAGNDTTVRIRGNLFVDGTTTTVNQTEINVQDALVFEGATGDDHETTLRIIDPTADRVISLPDTTGTVVTTGDSLTVATGMIANLGVTTGKIASGAVTYGKLATDSVRTAKILDANVTTAKIADDAVTIAKIDGITDAGSGSIITSAERTKLSGIATGAEVNVQSDWNASSGDAKILNKPNVQYTSAIPDATASQTGLATSTQITKLDAIEASADVTDATNVNAAGAVMHTDIPDTDTGFIKRTGSETYDIDTNTYLTSLSVTGLSDVSAFETNIGDGVSGSHDSIPSALAVKTYVDNAQSAATGSTTFTIEDDDNDTLLISQGKHIKFDSGTGISTDWTDTDNGTNADPYTMTIANTGVTSNVAGTGISVSGATGAVTVTNTDLGSSQNIFKNIKVSGQSDIVAETNDDDLTFAAGSNVTLTTDATNDTLTIASSYVNDDVSVANLKTRLNSDLGGDFTIGTQSDDTATFTGGLIIGGNLTVNGTTTTLDTANLAVEDKNIVLASGNTGVGVLDGTGFTFEGGSSDDITLQTASNVLELKLGSNYGSMKAGTFTGDLTGDVTGNADTATEATNVTATANNSTDETVYPVFVDGAEGTQGIETDTGFTYNPSTGLLTVGGLTTGGTVQYGSLSDGAITITAFESTLTNGAALVPTSAAVKTYVDAQVDTVDSLGEMSNVTLTNVAQGHIITSDDSGAWSNRTLTGGTNVSITNASSGAITIASTDTTYTATATKGIALSGSNAFTLDDPANTSITLMSSGAAGGQTPAQRNADTADEILIWDADNNEWAFMTLAHLADYAVDNGGESDGIKTFRKILVDSDTNSQIEAEITADTLNITSGSGITVASTAGTDTLTFSIASGAISNAMLANDSVSFGGVSLDLGQSDATPAFDLTDATNYPTSSLTGTITNAQLAGSIANSKLSNSTITVSDGSNSTATALGGTITFAATANETTVAESSGTVTIGLPDDVTLGGDLTIAEGNHIYFDSTDTYIKTNTDNPEDLLIAADEDIFLRPDDDLHIQAGTTTYATFDGTNQRLGLGLTTPKFPLHVKYTDNRTDPEGSGSSSGAGAIGASAEGGGLYIENASTTDGSWAGVTFRTDTADARIAYQSVGSSLSNEGQMSFFLDTNDSNDDVYTLQEVLRLRGGNSNGGQSYNSVDLPTNDARLRLGASQQLEFKFDGSHTRITHDAATDSWMIFKNEDGAGFQFNIGNDKGIEINKDGNVELYYDNSKKIETTATGVTVSGDGTFQASGSPTLTVQSTSTSGAQANLVLHGARNADNTVGQITFSNNDNSGTNTGTYNAARIIAFNHGGDKAGGLKFQTTPAGSSTTLATALTIEEDTQITTASDLTVGGNLIVSGTTTTINTATVEVEDNILQLNTTQGSPDTATAATSGISIYRGDGVDQASLIFDDGDDTWDLTNHLTVAGTLTATLTGDVTGEILGPSADNRITVSESDDRITFRTNGGNRFVIYNNGVSTFTGAVNVDNINLDGNTISSTDTNGDITITPNGTGDIVLDSQKWPQADGSAGQILKTDGSGQLSWVDGSTVAGDALSYSGTTANGVLTYGSASTIATESTLTYDPSGMLKIDVSTTDNSGSTWARMELHGDSGAYIDMGNHDGTNDDFDVRLITDGTGLDIITAGSGNHITLKTNGTQRVKVEDALTFLNTNDVKVGKTSTAGYLYLSADAAGSYLGWNADGTDITLRADDDLVLRADDDMIFKTGGTTKLTLNDKGELYGSDTRQWTPNSYTLGVADGNNANKWIKVCEWIMDGTNYDSFSFHAKVTQRGNATDWHELVIRGEFATTWWTKDFNIHGPYASTAQDNYLMVFDHSSGGSDPKATLYFRNTNAWNKKYLQIIQNVRHGDSIPATSWTWHNTTTGSTSTPTTDGETNSSTMSPDYFRTMGMGLGGANDTQYRVYNGTTATAMYLDTANQRVGIATSSPDVPLDVTTGSAGKLLQLNDGNTSGTYMGICDTRGMIGYNGNLVLQGGYSKGISFCVNNGTFGSGAVASFDTSGTFNVVGAITAATKSFDIEHPTEEGKRLHHGVLEGPEHGVYIRGRLEGDTIELPDYWLGLVDEDTITVQLTPNKGFQQIYVDHIEDNKVYVGTQTDTPIDCFYFIQAERKDVEKMVVEY